MNFYTSDQHFGHANVIKYDKRPFEDLDQMHATIIKRWNDKVTKNDHVYILGDFAFSKTNFKKYADQLNGILHFIPGNHDPKNLDKTELKDCLFHQPIHTVKDNGRKVVLCHFPIREWNGFYHGVVHFHGHTHGSIGKSFQPNAYDVGTMNHDYTPVSYDELVKSLHDYKTRDYNSVVYTKDT